MSGWKLRVLGICLIITDFSCFAGEPETNENITPTQLQQIQHQNTQDQIAQDIPTRKPSVINALKTAGLAVGVVPMLLLFPEEGEIFFRLPGIFVGGTFGSIIGGVGTFLMTGNVRTSLLGAYGGYLAGGWIGGKFIRLGRSSL